MSFFALAAAASDQSICDSTEVKHAS